MIEIAPCGLLRSTDARLRFAGRLITSAGNRRSTQLYGSEILAVHLRIRCASQKFSLSRSAQKLVSFDDHPAPGKNDIRHTSDRDAFEHRVVDAHVVSLGADRVFTF